MNAINLSIESLFNASDKSRKAYRKEGLRFVRATARNKKSRTATDIAETLQNYVGDRRLSRSTYRHYRNSIAYALAEVDGAEAALSFNQSCRSTIVAPPQKKRRYLKKVPNAVVSALINHAAVRELKSFGFVARLIFCMYYTAVRPGEWSKASYNPTTGILSVKNSKFKASDKLRRGNGEERWLDIDPENNRALEANITRLIDEMKGVEWQSRQGHASRTLKKMLTELVKEKRISRWWLKLRIYDFRHQCCANLKARFSGQPTMVAAMMGHYSASTAYVHYGQRRYGRAGNVRVTPTKESEFLVSKASVERLSRRMLPSKARKPLEPEFRGRNNSQVIHDSPSPHERRTGPNYSPG